MPTEQARTQPRAPALENAGTLPTTPPAPPPFGSLASPRRKRRPGRWWGAAAIAVAAGLSFLLTSLGPLQALELKTYDLRFILAGSQPSLPSGIQLVMIDEAAEATFPEPRIFWHPHYAELLRAAQQGGARALGLDVSFAISVEPWAPDLDRQLAAAFAETSAFMPVVLAYDVLQGSDASLPLYLLASMQDALGFANVTLDPDGVVRRQELLTRDEQRQESFAARLAAASTGQAWTRSPEGTLQLGEQTVPLDSSGLLKINFRGPSGSFQAVSMADVLHARQRGDEPALQEWFGGRIVLVGASDPADQQATPFYLAGGRPLTPQASGRGQPLTVGVEIHANTLATLLQRNFLQETSRPAAALILLAAAALGVLAGFRARFQIGAALIVAGAAAYFLLAALALREGWIVPVTAPIVALAMGGFGAYGIDALTEGRRRKALQDVFGRYVSPELAREVLEYGDLSLGGVRQPVTVMFTDLRNYTHYCQGRDPAQVVEELNEYFAEMAAEIKAHGGMVNKFIGDGIMALFGAPVPHPDDARRAVACGLRMVERNEQFNRRRASQGQPPLVIGVGLHTGDAVVGNIGAPEKMEYTAIGDTVNVASRIESENKAFGTRLLLSEATYHLVSQDYDGEPVGDALLKGIDQPVRLYSIRGRK